jgi:phospholipid/cholesterol/gamma-HCH transport system permease protein
MLANASSAQLVFDSHHKQLHCQGAWTTSHLAELTHHWPVWDALQTTALQIDGSKLSHLDSAGAWLLYHLKQQLEQRNIRVAWVNFSKEYQALLDLVNTQGKKIGEVPLAPSKKNWLYNLGKNVVDKCLQAKDSLTFVGETAVLFLYSLSLPKRIQWRSLLNTIDETGFRALPIIGLLLFLIGIVLAYQMGLQLKVYGANVYIVDITGLAMLQEFAPLITAIIIAGRSGSAITAQIGTMKINQEIDALLTMGLSPIERLVIPKILGLIIALPLLTVWADIFGMLGTLIMAKHTLGINYYDFLSRFPHAVSIKTFFKGLSKAPVFAVIITVVGCFQGFQVSSNADSLGRQTTKSVVQSIFLIIIADAIFSIIYSWQVS